MNKPKQTTFAKFNKRISKIELSEETKGGLQAMQIMIGFMLLQVSLAIIFQTPPELISPFVSNDLNVKAATQSAKTVDVHPIHTGTASYYSRAGCVGCSPTMTMANGQPLDDNALTVAFNRSKLGSKVRVINEKTGESVIATVTDTGGFERHNRIIDLTIATRDAINCSHLCQVKVELL